MKKSSLLPKMVITGVAGIAVLMGTWLSPAVAAEAVQKTVTFSDDARVFTSSEQDTIKVNLANVEAETGLNFAVKITNTTDDTVNEAAEAKKLAETPGDGDTVSIVINTATKNLQLDRGEKASKYIPLNTFTGIIDDVMVPKMSEGKYVDAISSGAQNFGTIYESNNPEIVASNDFKLFLKQYGVPVLAGTIVLLGALIIYIITGEKKARISRKKDENILGENYAELEKKTVAFWADAQQSLKNDFENANNSEARIQVLDTRTADYFQSFAPSPASLAQMLMTFVYPTVRNPNASIKAMQHQEEEILKRSSEVNEKWNSLTPEQQSTYVNASSESHQELLVSKFFPDVDGEIMVSRLRTFVPESRSQIEGYEDKATERNRIAKQNKANGNGNDSSTVVNNDILDSSSNHSDTSSSDSGSSDGGTGGDGGSM